MQSGFQTCTYSRKARTITPVGHTLESSSRCWSRGGRKTSRCQISFSTFRMTQTSQSLAWRVSPGLWDYSRSCESRDENTDLFSGFGCTRTSLLVSGANIGWRAIPSNHDRVGLGGGQRCRTPMLVRLSVASGHRFSVCVTPGLSRSRRLSVIVDAYCWKLHIWCTCMKLPDEL